ncbi:isochorismate synthase [Telluribacter sp.]|jgi:isochorismate synthase|uniref:isochorismate synthase n=1 Tax=Telluribacter sp. TaxID=1978767 RepID=UPI002E12CBE2|nr:isochorismate synthase [Telluribacter sp.]
MIDSQPADCSITSLGYQAEVLWEAARSLGFPAALWRLPNQEKIRLLISVSEGVNHRQPDLDTLPSGFMVSPFATNARNEVFFIEGDIQFLLLPEGPVQVAENRLGEEHPSVKKFYNAAETARRQKTADATAQSTWLHPVPTNKDIQKESFQGAVVQAVEAIRQKQFDKVVLSRTRVLTYTDDFRPVKAFTRLTSTYPAAFVSLVYLPEQQEVWLGASPETLVSQDAGGLFRTASLAGTQVARTEAGTLLPKGEVRWGQKEIEEQALVSRYIVECFKKIRLREYLEKGPKTVLAGNLYHLRTDFEVDTGVVNFPELGTTMLRLLHPTSAVCGMPKEPALRFLTAKEGYDRSLYSGYLGPVNVEGESHLFVNLRTMRLAGGVATVFAGAGITEDSEPQREWEETELKCQTLLRVLAPES